MKYLFIPETLKTNMTVVSVVVSHATRHSVKEGITISEDLDPHLASLWRRSGRSPAIMVTYYLVGPV